MDLLPLLTIPLLFLFVVLLKPFIDKRFHFNVCAVCVAVSLTWIILLILLFTNVIHNTTPVAILMGMSLTGFLYKLEGYYKVHNLRHLWIARLIVILGGFLTTTWLLEKDTQGSFLIGISSMLLLIIITFLAQGTTHDQAVAATDDDVKKSLLKKLDNCC